MVKDLQAIIFDLGGVIIDLDVSDTINQLSLLTGFSTEEVNRLYHQHIAFIDFEKGHIGSDKFRDNIRELFQKPALTDVQIDHAWNAMIKGLPVKKLELLLSLKDRYQVMILSNTNTIHIDYVYRMLLPGVARVDSLEPFVHKIYYSHLLGCRKPEQQIYQHVLNENDLDPGKTLFLDDNQANIMGAEALGINVKYIRHPDEVYAIFS